jgi:hypothetical protein
VIDLEHALTDLAEHLDVRADDDWERDLERRLTEPTPIRRQHRVHALVAAAAAIAVVAAGVLAVAPARRAVAGWLGIGAVKVSQGPPPTAGPTSPDITRPTAPPLDLAAAQQQVDFEITPPSNAGAPSRVTVDRRVPGGLVTLSYDDFTVVEIATNPDEPVISKFVDGGPVDDVVVHGHAGMWIPDAHGIGYIDRAGRLRPGTLRRSGPVLVWSVDDVTFRVEGPPTLDEAMDIANTIV